jgi:hypothetical protein
MENKFCLEQTSYRQTDQDYIFDISEGKLQGDI